jgi:hypothetical protein
MREWARICAGIVAVTGLLALVSSAGAGTCKLETKRIDPTASVSYTAGRLPMEYYFRSRPQSIFMQIGGPNRIVPRQTGAPEFDKVINKELSKYNSEMPFRGVVKLGSKFYGFVFDTAPEKKDEGKDEAKVSEKAKAQAAKMKSVAYTRIHFDLNGNGDLTDDKVIESKPVPQSPSLRSYSRSSFPPIDIKIDVDGAQLDYAFSMSVYANVSSQLSYANASISSAAYLEGEMEIAGKKHRVVVVDYNSNGRFDDQSGINESIRSSSVYYTMGDMLYLIDPTDSPSASTNPYDPTANNFQHYVGKLVNHGGQFFNLSIANNGEELTLEPSPVPLGQVMNPNKGYSALVYGDQGFVKLVGDDSGVANLPEGEWRLASYTINREPTQEKPKKDTGSSMIGALTKALTGSSSSRPRPSLISASGQRDTAPIVVKKGETVEMPFGAPFKPVVKASFVRGQKTARLSMSLVGAGGETASNLIVNGSRPGNPKFTITTEDGTEVASGEFEYG